jgi:hypothetical protein
MYATAGSDRAIRVYDEASRRVLCTLRDGDGVSTAGHTNNVYSIAWKPEDWQVRAACGALIPGAVAALAQQSKGACSLRALTAARLLWHHLAM